jgi:uncharacterized spore protein YtfJ
MEVEELLSRLGESITVGRAFGPAYEKDGCLVIPVAWVAGGGGGGSGVHPKTPDPAGPQAALPPATGSQPTGSDAAAKRPEGSGGGFGVVAWPLGVYVVRDGNVRWVPAIDVTRLILLSAAAIRLLVRGRSRRRALAGAK